MNFNYTLDPSITNSPLASSIESAIGEAIVFFQSQFSNNVTINLNFGYGEADNKAIPVGDVAHNFSEGSFVSYSTLRSALSHSTVYFDNFATPLSSVLPTTDPTAGGQFFVPYAAQKALGLMLANSTEVDGYIGLSNQFTYAWGQNVISGSGQNDAVGAIEHEISEVMGRLGFLGTYYTDPPSHTNQFGPMDLFRYSSVNGSTVSGRNLATSGSAYLSIDGQNVLQIPEKDASSLGSFGFSAPARFNDPSLGGDVADWNPNALGDSFGSNGTGIASPIGSTDTAIMQALGWKSSLLPDLTINNLNVSSISVAQGHSLTISYEFDNIGFGTIGASPTAVLLSTDTTITNLDTLLGNVLENEISGDSSKNDTVAINIPINVAPGTYYIGAIADSNFNLSESVFTNNTSTNVVQITILASPEVTAGATATFTGGGSPVVLDGSLTLSDPGGGGNLIGAMVSISSGFVSGDTLNFIVRNGINGSYDSAHGVLTLSGTSSLTNYQAALESITYSFSPGNGDPTNGGSGQARTISWVATDSSSSSTAATSTLNVIHVAPSVIAGANVTFMSSGPAVKLDAALTVSDPDSGGNLIGAVISISTGFLAGDALNFIAQNGINGSYDAAHGILTLTGTASLANYQTALESVTYNFSPVNGDPTAGGSDPIRTISWAVDDGSTSAALHQVPSPISTMNILNALIPSDFNGDGTSDVLLQSGGTVVDWIEKNGLYSTGNLLTTGATGFTVVGSGDFNGDGTADVLLQSGGTVVDWIIKNGQYQTGNVLTTAATGFTVVGTGDFNGDGTADVLLQSGGTVVDWIMQNGQYQSGNVLTTGATGFTVVGKGDFNGDGTADALLQSGGTVVDWIMKNGQYQSGNILTTGATGFTVVGTGDFNGDGTSDVLLQSGGTVVDWIMKNGKYQSGNVLTTGATGFSVVGAGDYNGDGTADILLQNGGTVVDWIIKNGQYQTGNVLTTGATGFNVIAS
jgi:hypothetical protein